MGGEGTIPRMTLRQVFPALLAVAFVSVAAGAQDMELNSRTVQLNSDLTAQIMTIARDGTGTLPNLYPPPKRSAKPPYPGLRPLMAGMHRSLRNPLFFFRSVCMQFRIVGAQSI